MDGIAEQSLPPVAQHENGGHDKDKLTGYLLLAAGIFLIFATVIFVFLTFTGRLKPAQVFNVPAPTVTIPNQSADFSNSAISAGLGASASALLNSAQSKPPEPIQVKILPDEAFSTLLNLSVFYLLSMFIGATGVRLGTLGINLIKTPKIR